MEYMGWKVTLKSSEGKKILFIHPSFPLITKATDDFGLARISESNIYETLRHPNDKIPAQQASKSNRNSARKRKAIRSRIPKDPKSTQM